MKNNKHIQTFNEHQENLNISDVSRSTYPSLHRLFNFLPKIGYGEVKEFRGSEKDLEFAYDVLNGLSSSGLIFKRTGYLMDGGELDIKEWYEYLIKNENSFQTYMLKNHNFKNGDIIFGKNIEELEKLATKYFEYYE